MLPLKYGINAMKICTYPHVVGTCGNTGEGKIAIFVDPTQVAPRNSEKFLVVQFGGVTRPAWVSTMQAPKLSIFTCQGLF